MSDVSLIPITELCEVERAKSGKRYPSGTCYVTLSAANDNVNQLTEDGEIETRYAAIVPRAGTEPDYIKVVLDRAFPRWLEAHRTGINLKFEELPTLVVEWHADPDARREAVEAVRRLDALASMEEETIRQLQELKSYLLLRMFV